MSPRFVRRSGLLLLVLLGVALRLPGLFANTFHADDALFALWARLIAVWRDPLLQTQLVDKPPLPFYLQALFYPLLATPAGWPARLPGLIAGILLVPLTGRLAWSLYRDNVVALVAAALVALSPLAVQFSASAFTDPLLVAWLAAALWLMVRREGARPGTAGLLFGLALLCKYQAVLFLPLLAGLGYLSGWGRWEWGRWLVGMAPAVLLLIVWDVARNGWFSLWSIQYANYGGLRPVWSWELGPRLLAWGALWRTLFGGPLLFGGTVLLLPAVLLLEREKRGRAQALDWLFLLFVLAYMTLHWLLAIPAWDRYLLPLVPPAGLLLGRLTSRIVQIVLPARGAMRAGVPLVAGMLLLVLLLPGGLAARQGAFPLGARPGADSGAAQVAALLADEPYGTVLYDHWWSQHWRYYFFDRGVYVKWFAHPAGLAADLAVFGGDGQARYLVLPRGEVGRPVLRAVRAAGFGVERVLVVEGMVLYRVTQLLTVNSEQLTVNGERGDA